MGVHTRDDIGEDVEQRFWKHVAKGGPDECWEWASTKNGRGYGKLWMPGGPQLAHRISFLIAFGWLSAVTMHKCDNPPCVNPRHLFGGTHADNAADRVSKGRTTYKTTPRVRSTIYALSECGVAPEAIGRQVGVSRATVYRVLARRATRDGASL
jgi:hypothetical protein